MQTDCESCCFLQKDDTKCACVADQLCVLDNNVVSTPGFCKIKRTYRWKQKHSVLDINDLLSIVNNENILSFDLIILFNENKNSIDDLNRTLESNWMKQFCKQIIVADTTGIPKRDRKFLDSIKNKTDHKMLVDCSCDPENEVRTIRRLALKCKEKYFIVISAGKQLSDIDKLSENLKNNDDRNIYYKFPTKHGSTKIDLMGDFISGMYIAKIFNFITKKCTQDCIENQPCECSCFYFDLFDEQEKCGIKLSNTIWDTCLI